MTKEAPDQTLQALLLGRGGVVPKQLSAPTSLIAVQSKSLPYRPESPFSQMIREQSQGSNLSAADQKALRGANPMVQRLVGGTSSPMGGLKGNEPFISNKLLQHGERQRVAAEAEQLLANAQPRVPGLHGKGVKHRLGVARVGANPGQLPSLHGFEDDQPKKKKRDTRGTKSPQLVPHDPKQAHPGVEEEILESVEVPDTFPVNRKCPTPEPATEEERLIRVTEGLISKCRHGRYEELKGHLEAGFNVDAQDSKGNTILITACQNNNKKIVKLCLRRGCDVMIKNHKGHDALYYCTLYQHDALAQYILEKK